jgi:hypothetical protein
VALGIGGLLAWSAKSKASGASCDTSNVCETSADVEQRREAVAQANVATAVVVAGAALVVGGSVLLFAAPSHKADAARSPKTGLTRAGVGLSGLLLEGKF